MTIESAVARTPDRRSLPGLGKLYRFLARRLIARVASGMLELHLPDGEVLVGKSARPGPQGVLVIHRWAALTKTIRGGQIGFADGYIAGDWSTPDLVALLSFLAGNEAAFGRIVAGAPFVNWLQRRLHGRNENTPDGSRRNIRAHYDLGNDFYRLWLDASMTYSAALFPPGETLSLEAAQRAKMAEIARLLALEEGLHVLEIGCGWGALAAHLAGKHGASVKGITLSNEQLEAGNARLEQAGLSAQAQLHLEDYRETTGQFDRIVSIEMIEAVGEAWWPAYFRQIADLLKPGGHAVIQAITIDAARFDGYRSTPDFIQRYIFPGGMLPTTGIIAEQAEAAGLVPRIERSFGADYARTLSQWRRQFQDAWPKISDLGYPAHFRELWDYYLAYCQAGFEIRQTDVHLITLRKPA